MCRIQIEINREVAKTIQDWIRTFLLCKSLKASNTTIHCTPGQRQKIKRSIPVLYSSVAKLPTFRVKCTLFFHCTLSLHGPDFHSFCPLFVLCALLWNHDRKVISEIKNCGLNCLRGTDRTASQYDFRYLSLGRLPGVFLVFSTTYEEVDLSINNKWKHTWTLKLKKVKAYLKTVWLILNLIVKQIFK